MGKREEKGGRKRGRKRSGRSKKVKYAAKPRFTHDLRPHASVFSLSCIVGASLEGSAACLACSRSLASRTLGACACGRRQVQGTYRAAALGRWPAGDWAAQSLKGMVLSAFGGLSMTFLPRQCMQPFFSVLGYWSTTRHCRRAVLLPVRRPRCGCRECK